MKPYKKTSSTVKTGYKLDIEYGIGSVEGLEYNDTVTLAPGLVIKNQGIGAASKCVDFNGIDGLLGVGPIYLSNSLKGHPNVFVPTVIDTAYAQGLISYLSIRRHKRLLTMAC